MPAESFAIGVDIGGGSTKIGLVSGAGIVADRERVVVEAADTADRILARYGEAIEGILARNARVPVGGIGIGFPGIVQEANGCGRLCNIPVLNGFPLAGRLSSRFSLPARMENDGTAAAVAEALFGRDREAERLLLITAGTGIGVACAVGGRPLVTSGSGMGDAGHTLVQFDDPVRCRQGCLGCLESVASADALNRMLARFVREEPDAPIARRAAAEGRAPEASDIVVCAKAGDPAASAMLRAAGRWIGRAAATWTHIFAPTVILLGGGLSAAGELLLEPIEAEARRIGLAEYFRDVRFALASLGNDAGMIGAAAQIFSGTKA